MKIVVLGSGVTGVTTAYKLAKKGCQVTIIDQFEQAGMGSSYGNGGQLSYGYKTPIANPKVLKQLPKILSGLDPAFRIYPSLDLDFYLWGLRFLAQCSPGKSQHSAKIMTILGRHSQKCLMDIITQTGIEFDYRQQSGKLYVCQNETIMLDADQDDRTVVWSKNELFDKIPALKNNQSVVGGIYESSEDAADCHKFCNELVRYSQNQHAVTVLNGHQIESLEHADSNIIGVQTDKGLVTADAYVMAMGPHSAGFMKPLGVKLPIYPMKGFSVTVPATAMCPDVSITDTHTKTVYCRLGERLRIAGFAEFSGMSTQIKQKRIDRMLNNARKFLPEAGDYDTVLESWCGLRPATPDSIPIVGECAFENLYLNTGHGMLGWTHSAATADLLTNCILQNPQPFDTDALLLSRF